MTTTTTSASVLRALTEVERIKKASRHLRGTLKESLADPLTGALRPDDTHLLKFHGSYQQDDRDVRDERRLSKLEPAYSFMLRTRLPGGVCTPKQWLLLDELARRFANGSLRLTTRQAFQLHGVVKPELKTVMQGLNRELLDTLAACGDVNRNVMCNPNPVESRVHAEVQQWAVRLSEHLLPKTKAYSSIWFDDDGQGGSGGAPDEEPIYGDTYLPRKFKAAIAVPPHNDVDVFAHDLGFIAIVDSGVLQGFNVTVGGGMGATHGDNATFPRVADVIGFIRPERLLLVAEHVVKTQRDHGDRTNRKHARLKYTIEDRGLPWFVDELAQRAGGPLAPARAFAFEHSGDRFGWVRGDTPDGRQRWHLTLHIESGRVVDRPGAPLLSGLRALALVHTGDFRLTANQNLIVAGVEAKDRARVDDVVRTHGLDGPARASPLKKNALACVALPTCALAMAEAERSLPSFVERFEQVLRKHAVDDVRLHLRITGCPNGCARPYLAEVALVGKGPGLYNLHVGGDVKGQRLNKLYRENLSEAAILEELEVLVARFATERSADEAFGDFTIRIGAV
ncbi:MAG: assimilatory sulfite reductase (NADPH) hemoprotein subunit [Deltaproteobacteria bacterium]|nr:assimilatory sulfite reductase (NADPH) hemoprotein subunit [Deltaproteobacteria bacterium]